MAVVPNLQDSLHPRVDEALELVRPGLQPAHAQRPAGGDPGGPEQEGVLALLDRCPTQAEKLVDGRDTPGAELRNSCKCMELAALVDDKQTVTVVDVEVPGLEFPAVGRLVRLQPILTQLLGEILECRIPVAGAGSGPYGRIELAVSQSSVIRAR